MASLSWMMETMMLPMLVFLIASVSASFNGATEVEQFISSLPFHRHGRETLQAGEVRPKIWIYEFPEIVAEDLKKHGDISDSFYGLDQYFPELLKASPYWTNNSNTADYFFVNVWTYWTKASPDEILRQMRAQGPFFDKKGGADHIFVITSDPGRCVHQHPMYAKAIFLQHHGKLFDRDREAIHTPVGISVCDLSKRWGSECDDQTMLAEAAIFKREIHPCHIPGQDIVVPSIHFEPHLGKDKQHTWQFKTPFIHPELQGLNRSNLLFYSGKIDLHAENENYLDAPWTDAAYSLGARQTIYRMFNGKPGFAIMNKHSHQTYWQLLSSSIFCLATTGWGWGGRMKVSVTRGCIPLIIQDGTRVEWEEQLPLREYALRLPLWMAHKADLIMQQQIKSGRVAKMQRALACTWRLHWWRRPEGRAFELTMCELKRRVLGKSRVQLDLDRCALECGDGKWVPLNTTAFNNV